MDIPQDLLDHELCLPVGIGGRGGHFFRERNGVVIAVYGSGRREYDLLASEFVHDLDQHHGGNQIVAVVPKRLFNAFANSLETCKVNHRVNFIGGEKLSHCFFVANVCLNEGGALACDRFDIIEHFDFGIQEIVNDDNFFADVLQFNNGMRTDIAGSACH